MPKIEEIPERVNPVDNLKLTNSDTRCYITNPRFLKSLVKKFNGTQNCNFDLIYASDVQFASTEYPLKNEQSSKNGRKIVYKNCST
jgi:hypothetical protein